MPQASGGSRLKASGKRPMLLGLTPEQHARIAEAAAVGGEPMSAVATRGALREAEKILRKIPKTA